MNDKEKRKTTRLGLPLQGVLKQEQEGQASSHGGLQSSADLIRGGWNGFMCRWANGRDVWVCSDIQRRLESEPKRSSNGAASG